MRPHCWHFTIVFMIFLVAVKKQYSSTVLSPFRLFYLAVSAQGHVTCLNFALTCFALHTLYCAQYCDIQDGGGSSR